MKILADENFPRPIVDSLRKEQHDVLWARTDCPGLRDRELLDRAEADGRVLLTLDKDFLQVAFQRRVPLKQSGVILFRSFPAIPEEIKPLVETALAGDHAWIAHVSIVSKDGIEMISTERSQPGN